MNEIRHRADEIAVMNQPHRQILNDWKTAWPMSQLDSSVWMT